jgi:alanine racemase
VSIGYADGLRRIAGIGKLSLYVHGQPAPIVGQICMDMTMIDVTDIAQAQEGDAVEVFGQHQSIQQVAGVFGTIAYEVMTGISARVPRVFVEE